MERKIKFRGKRNNGEWAFGYYIGSSDKAWITANFYDIHYEVIPSTVGEFTGLKDKNGVDIYEGDLIEIEWHDDPYDKTVEPISFDVEYSYYKYGNNPICELVETNTFIKVIGNIYETSAIAQGGRQG